MLWWWMVLWLSTCWNHRGACPLKVFAQYIQSHLVSVQRLDLIFDQYIEGSLKASARAKRGQGIKRRVNAISTVPKEWQCFLSDDENKAVPLSSKVCHSWFRENCSRWSQTGNIDLRRSGPQRPYSCQHTWTSPVFAWRTGTRILHGEHAGRHGLKRFMIRTMDTNVLVLAIGTYSKLYLEEIWCHLVQERVLSIFRYISLLQVLEMTGPYWGSMLSQGAIKHNFSLERARRLHRRHGSTSIVSLLHLSWWRAYHL